MKVTVVERAQMMSEDIDCQLVSIRLSLFVVPEALFWRR
jgi:hypothetical protein